MVTHLKGLLKLSLSIAVKHHVLPDRKYTYFRRLNLILVEFRGFKSTISSTQNINSNLHKTVPKILQTFHENHGKSEHLCSILCSEKIQSEILSLPK